MVFWLLLVDMTIQYCVCNMAKGLLLNEKVRTENSCPMPT